MSTFMRGASAIVIVMSAACGSTSSDSDRPTGTGGGPIDGAGGCGGTGAGGTGNSGAGGEADGGPTDAAPPGDCRTTSAAHPPEGAQHVAVCSPLTFGTNPPSSGNHYAIWADYRTYDRPIARGFWVHSLEHGAVVITYNCPDGCAADVADAQALIDSLPADCGDGTRRLILAPDPELDVRFAASAWGFTLRSDCFDRETFRSFYSEHYDHAPESICGGGTDPSQLCSPSCK
jgi:hypothetical protein